MTLTHLSRDLVRVFSPDKLDEKRGIISRQAVYLLPLLFQGLVLTTNFDETLETVYREQGCPFHTVSHPGHTELLNQLTRQADKSRVRGLYKLHGTLTWKMIEYGNIVFTEKQYEHHYGDGSPLPGDLKKCLDRKAMLFLGCSLGSDRTMDLLKD